MDNPTIDELDILCDGRLKNFLNLVTENSSLHLYIHINGDDRSNRFISFLISSFEGFYVVTECERIISASYINPLLAKLLFSTNQMYDKYLGQFPKTDIYSCYIDLVANVNSHYISSKIECCLFQELKSTDYVIVNSCSRKDFLNRIVKQFNINFPNTTTNHKLASTRDVKVTFTKDDFFLEVDVNVNIYELPKQISNKLNIKCNTNSKNYVFCLGNKLVTHLGIDSDARKQLNSYNIPIKNHIKSPTILKRVEKYFE